MRTAFIISAFAILIAATLAYLYERMKWRRRVGRLKLQPPPSRYF
jgi:hypothetical protein